MFSSFSVISLMVDIAELSSDLPIDFLAFFIIFLFFDSPSALFIVVANSFAVLTDAELDNDRLAEAFIDLGCYRYRLFESLLFRFQTLFALDSLPLMNVGFQV